MEFLMMNQAPRGQLGRVQLGRARASQCGIVSSRGVRLQAFVFAWSLLASMAAGPLVSPVPAAAAEFEDAVESLNQDATQAFNRGDFEIVEKLRRERFSLIQKTKEEPWATAYATLVQVDGSKTDDKDVGLVNRLQYRDAYKKLKDAWTPFAARRNGPVFGEVAIRLFEVTQQALAVHPGALTDGDPERLATRNELLEIIETVIRHDPCSIEAYTIRAYLTEPAGNEAFLRAETRPSLTERNKMLVELSHHDGGSLMQWHSPVEMEKADNTLTILNDVTFMDFLQPERFSDDLDVVESGHFLSGRDGRSAPFQIIYGRYLLMEVMDKQGKPRPVLVTLDRKPGKNGARVWKKKYLHLLWRTPSADEARNPRVVRYKILFDQLHPTTTWKLGPERFSLYPLPIERSKELAESGIPNMSVRKTANLTNPKYSVTQNDPDFIWSKLAVAETHPDIKQKAYFLKLRNDRTKHSLIELMSEVGLSDRSRQAWQIAQSAFGRSSVAGNGPLAALNPILIWSDEDNESAEPFFLRDPNNRPFLSLDDQRSLVFIDTDKSEFAVQAPGGICHQPLFIEAIPDVLIVSTEAGRLLEKILIQVGYTSAQALEEIRRAFRDPEYIPSKFEAVIRAKMKSATSRQVTFEQAAAEILSENGWERNWTPGDELRGLYSIFGFRYISDARGNLITHPDLTGGTSQAGGVTRNDNPKAFDFRGQDGRQTLDDAQVYSKQDYRDLERNVASRFYPHVLAFHPCLPSLWMLLEYWADIPGQTQGTIKDSTLTITSEGKTEEIRIPDKPFPAWMITNNAARDQANRLFSDFAKTMALALNPAHRERFVSLQLRAARDLAKQRRFHQSIVFYNDLLADFTAPPAIDFSLFEKVPDSNELRSFAGSIEEVLGHQKIALLIQAELGAVLRAAGLKGSAHYLWSSVYDQFVLYTNPSIEASIDYAKSYGFAPAPGLAVTREMIETLLKEVARDIKNLANEREYREAAMKPAADEARARVLLAELSEAFARDERADGKAADKAELAQLEELQKARRSLGVWLEEKTLFATQRPNFLYGGGHETAPMRLAPARYDREAGFTIDWDSLFSADLFGNLAIWARLPEAEANAAPDAGRFNFILGWYWLDRGDFYLAKRAFTASARAFANAAANEAGDVTAGLTARRNSMMMLVMTASVTQLPAGVKYVRTGFLDGLIGQMTMWERKWVSKGLEHAHATRERVMMVEHLDAIKATMLRRNRAVEHRYFFPDYRFQFGPIPERLLADALKYKLYEDVPRMVDGEAVAKRIEDCGPKNIPPPPPPKEGEQPPPPPKTWLLTFDKLMELAYPLPQDIDPKVMELN